MTEEKKKMQKKTTDETTPQTEWRAPTAATKATDAPAGSANDATP